ncbi:hypothetical protein FRB96_009646 [Tulasnella sp. 330]|nr:hypothetical protein FRB96_009646 [Tulasnella sp. 330]
MSIFSTGEKLGTTAEATGEMMENEVTALSGRNKAVEGEHQQPAESFGDWLARVEGGGTPNHPLTADETALGQTVAAIRQRTSEPDYEEKMGAPIIKKAMAQYKLKINVAVGLAGRYVKDRSNPKKSRDFVALLLKLFTNEGAKDLGLPIKDQTPENVLKHLTELDVVDLASLYDHYVLGMYKEMDEEVPNWG